MIIKSSLLFIGFNCFGGHRSLMSFSVPMHQCLAYCVPLFFFPPTLLWDYGLFGTLEYKFTDNIYTSIFAIVRSHWSSAECLE